MYFGEQLTSTVVKYKPELGLSPIKPFKNLVGCITYVTARHLPLAGIQLCPPELSVVVGGQVVGVFMRCGGL